MDFTETVELTESELHIASALADMAIARGGTFDDYQTPVYLRGLVDLDAGLVGRACEQIGLEPRDPYSPVVPPVGTIRARVFALAREDTAKIAAAKLLPAPVAEPDEQPYFCLECRDEPNAWVVRWCRGRGKSAVVESTDRGLAILPCARRDSHPPHSYAERCACLPSNPVIAGHRRRIRDAQQRKSERQSS